MNPMDVFKEPLVSLIALCAIGGWIFTTWLRVRHGYPLEGSWGQELKPGATSEMVERIKLLTTEKAQLSAELGSLKDRVAVLERIVTDRGVTLSAEIDSLRH